MRLLRRILPLSGVLLAMCGGWFTPLHLAAQADKSAKIVFTSSREGANQIYIMNSDGSDQKRLTSGSEPNELPSWSPDGSQILFTGRRNGNRDIYVMNADGTGERRLTTDPGEDQMPAWSPDGRLITFQSARDGHWQIYIMNPDGTNQRNISNSPKRVPRDLAGFTFLNDGPASWSPDSKQLVFASGLGDPAQKLYVMDADGTGKHLVISHKW